MRISRHPVITGQTREQLVPLSAGVPLRCNRQGLLFANSIIFVGLAAIASLGLVALAQRHMLRIVESSVAFLATLALGVVYYEFVNAPNVIPSLSAFWTAYYVPRHKGISGALSFLRVRGSPLVPYLGGRHLSVDLLFVASGLITLVWLKRYALAAIVPITLLAVIAASAARKYPFGDLRTSTFWLVMVALLMAVGVVGITRLVARSHSYVAVLPLSAALVLYTFAVYPYIRSQPLPGEDVRSQVAYVNSHRQTGDVVIVNYAASWGFAYYEHEVKPSFQQVDYASNGFRPFYPGVTWLVAMPNRAPANVTEALAAATRRLRTEREPKSNRIWIIRSHLAATEAAAWTAELAGKNVVRVPLPEPVLLYLIS